MECRVASTIVSAAPDLDIMVVRFAVVLCFHLSLLNPVRGMEPLALLATQPVWQAAQPITVNVDYDGKLRKRVEVRFRPHVYVLFPQFPHSAQLMKLWNCSKPQRLNTILRKGVRCPHILQRCFEFGPSLVGSICGAMHAFAQCQASKQCKTTVRLHNDVGGEWTRAWQIRREREREIHGWRASTK
jgi:hypothetical protein